MEYTGDRWFLQETKPGLYSVYCEKQPIRKPIASKCSGKAKNSPGKDDKRTLHHDRLPRLISKGKDQGSQEGEKTERAFWARGGQEQPTRRDDAKNGGKKRDRGVSCEDVGELI